MNPARDAILSAIQLAVAGGEATEGGAEVPREYCRRGTTGPKAVLDLLQERIEDYRAEVIRCRSHEIPGVLSRRLSQRQVCRVVAPSDVPEAWLESLGDGEVEILRDGSPKLLTVSELAASQAVVGGCALAIAETGTLVLDGGVTQGRRALTLLPDFHLCVVFQGQVVETVPEALQALEQTQAGAPRPLTFISGPSATSDIELIRVEGVHGPRILDVILVEDS